MDADGDPPICPICNDLIATDRVKLYRKGLDSLIAASVDREDQRLTGKLQDLEPGTGFVHSECRKRYTDKRRREAEDERSEVSAKKLRSVVESFDWKKNCFFCGEDSPVDDRHPDRDENYEVRTLELRDRVIELCASAEDHEWSEAIRGRLQDCHDLVAVEARYHTRCLKAFTRGRVTSASPGRPRDERMQEYFSRLCTWLETEGEVDLFTVEDLVSIMQQLAGGDEVYTSTSLRRELQKKYEDHVFFAKVRGRRKDVVCIRDMASYIVSETWHQERCSDRTEECKRIMATAARLAKEEVRARNYSTDVYRNTDDFKNIETANEFLTPCLSVFLETLIKNDLKRVGIGHAITQAVAPRSVISPVMFGLGVEMDHVFGSKWLLNQLYSLGFSISYTEVARFKQAVLQDESVVENPNTDSSELVQFAADNADVNIDTIDGSGTFHGMYGTNGTYSMVKAWRMRTGQADQASRKTENH